MKVTIEHSQQKTGVFNKINHYIVHVKVELSEEETRIITDMGLQGQVILESTHPSHTNGKSTDLHRLTFGDLMRGDDYWSSPILSNAKVYEVELIEALKKAKNFLNVNATLPETPKTFEL